MNIEIIRSALERAVMRVMEGDESAKIPGVLYGIRLLGSKEAVERLNPYGAYLASMEICDWVSELTPRQFAQMFPIKKVYDGARRGVKDYFWTVQMIEDRSWDTPIGDAMGFLWDYMNEHVLDFMVNIMIWASAIRRARGEEGIAEEFSEAFNIRPWLMLEDQRGRKYFVTPEGRTIPMRRTRVKHLRVVR